MAGPNSLYHNITNTESCGTREILPLGKEEMYYDMRFGVF